MKICVIGAGYVGLVTAACLAKIGHKVTCLERDSDRLNMLSRGICPIYEPGLQAIIERAQLQEALDFTNNMKLAASFADVIFVAVGTPPRDDGSSDLTQVLDCVSEVSEHAKQGAVIVTKSTVPMGTNKLIRRIVESARPNARLKVASNPEFLREGSAISDFEAPDRIVIGSNEKSASNTLKKIYEPITSKGVQLILTSCENAELIKYASNAFLAMKVTFANELSDLCEVAGGEMDEVVRGLGLDNRIGPKFLNPGPGYGGSCFPKDTRALAHMGRTFGARQTIVEAVIDGNKSRKENTAKKILGMLGPNPVGKVVCVWGLAFKANTDDIRDAPSVSIIGYLESAGIKVRAHDPKAMKAAETLLPMTSFFSTPLEAAKGADLIIALTDWAEYREIEFKKLAVVVRKRFIADFRNFLPGKKVTASGFRLFTIGKGMGKQQPPTIGRLDGTLDKIDDRRIAIS